MNVQDDLENFCQFALKLGAFSAKPVPVKEVEIGNWVRLKCQFGCTQYDRKFHCPPLTPTPASFKKVLREYEWAILVGFKLPLQPYKERKDYNPYKVLVQRILFAIERRAFLVGYYKAFCLSSGGCMLCYPKKCRMKNSIRNAIYGLFGLRPHCRNARMSRPSMEALGIDVFATARKFGLPIEVLRSHKEYPTNYGLILIV